MATSNTRTSSPSVSGTSTSLPSGPTPSSSSRLATSTAMQRESRPGSRATDHRSTAAASCRGAANTCSICSPMTLCTFMGWSPPALVQRSKPGCRVHAQPVNSRVSAGRCPARAPWPSSGSLSKLMCLSKKCWNAASSGPKLQVSIAVNNRSRPPSEPAMLPDVGTEQP